jgi:hypothetical protein
MIEDDLNRELAYVFYASNGDLDSTPIPNSDEKDKRIKQLEEELAKAKEQLKERELNILTEFGKADND